MKGPAISNVQLQCIDPMDDAEVNPQPQAVTVASYIIAASSHPEKMA